MARLEEAAAFERAWSYGFPGTLGSQIDLVTLRGLQLAEGVSCHDIWGVKKVQPAQLDIELRLRDGLQGAATHDALDTSTVHYGMLAKSVRRMLGQAGSIVSTLDLSACAIFQLVFPDHATHTAVSMARLTLTLPKASNHGDSCTIVDSLTFAPKDLPPSRVLRTFTFNRLKVMTLIGVNAVERTYPQTLLTTCSLYISRVDNLGEEEKIVEFLATYEKVLVVHIQQTSFETLEALSVHLHTKIEEDMRLQPNIVGLQLKLEKPSAVLHAEAPAIEIVRLFQ